MASITGSDEDKRIDSVILDAQKELEALRGEIDKYKVVFDSARLIVGHEFVKPLTSINGYVDLLEDDIDGTAVVVKKQYFLKIREGIRRIEELIETFIQMLRLDNLVEEMHDIEKVDLHRLVNKVKERFGEDSEIVENAVHPDLPELYLRRTGIEVVLENLISNAIKNNVDRKTIKITANLQRERRGSSKKHLLMVSVIDGGVGIPEEEMKDIFNPFYRVGGKEASSGLGLGLALVKSILRIMNGEIYVKSRTGKGTTVTFSVPIKDDVHVLPEKVG